MRPEILIILSSIPLILYAAFGHSNPPAKWKTIFDMNEDEREATFKYLKRGEDKMFLYSLLWFITLVVVAYTWKK